MCVPLLGAVALEQAGFVKVSEVVNRGRRRAKARQVATNILFPWGHSLAACVQAKCCPAADPRRNTLKGALDQPQYRPLGSQVRNPLKLFSSRVGFGHQPNPLSRAQPVRVSVLHERTQGLVSIMGDLRLLQRFGAEPVCKGE